LKTGFDPLRCRGFQSFAMGCGELFAQRSAAIASRGIAYTSRSSHKTQHRYGSVTGFRTRHEKTSLLQKFGDFLNRHIAPLKQGFCHGLDLAPMFGHKFTPYIMGACLGR
jgi:hypothetical protein